MKLKELLTLFVLLTIVGKTYGDEISVDPVSIKAGKNQNVFVKLNLADEVYSALQFDIVLPNGTTLKSSNNKYGVLQNDHSTYDEWSETWTHTMSSSLFASNETSTTYRFVIYDSDNAKLKSGDGNIVRITIVADVEANGELEASVKNIILASTGGAGGASDVGKVTLEDTQFTITVQGLPIVTADNKEREYGDSNPEFTYTVSEGEFTGLELTTEATISSPVGTYDIVVPASSTSEYVAKNGTLTIKKAPLSIGIGTITINQGEPLPSLSDLIYSGFKNNETSEVLTTQPTLTFDPAITPTGTPEPGTYTIIVSGAETENYDITYANGTLTIESNEYTDDFGNTIEYTGEGAILVEVSEGEIDDNGNLVLNTNVDNLTGIADDALNNLEKDAIKSVNLENLNVTINRASREEGLFAGFPESTLIYLPENCSADDGQKNFVIDGNCEELFVSEDKDFNAPRQFNVHKVEFDREFVSGVTATVYLPFTIPCELATSLGTFHSFKDINAEGQAAFNAAETGDIEAYTPYIFIPSTTQISITDNGYGITVNVAGATEGTNGELVGTTEAITWTTSPENTYGFAGAAQDGAQVGDFVKVGVGASIKPYRAYLVIGDATAAARSYPVIVEDGHATGIQAISKEVLTSNDQWHNINGQKLSNVPTTKGFYIKNGQKTIIK